MRLLDLFCGAGGAAMGYYNAGFTEIVGVDNRPMPRYPFTFVQADALEYLAQHGQEFDAIHASPPCQGYSIMQNLPWLHGKEYPLLILPTLEMLEALGKPYVLENVMGARYGAVGLRKRGLEAQGLKAGWLCGAMFGLPFYHHRLFASNWFWLAPGHPKHSRRIHSGRLLGGRARDIVFGQAEDARGRESWPNRRPYNQGLGGVLSLTPPHQDIHRGAAGLDMKPKNGAGLAQAGGVGVGHARGWRLAAEAMGIDWMNRGELTQAIPPCYTEFIGKALLAQISPSRDLSAGHSPGHETTKLSFEAAWKR